MIEHLLDPAFFRKIQLSLPRIDAVLATVRGGNCGLNGTGATGISADTILSCFARHLLRLGSNRYSSGISSMAAGAGVPEHLRPSLNAGCGAGNSPWMPREGRHMTEYTDDQYGET